MRNRTNEDVRLITLKNIAGFSKMCESYQNSLNPSSLGNRFLQTIHQNIKYYELRTLEPNEIS